MGIKTTIFTLTLLFLFRPDNTFAQYYPSIMGPQYSLGGSEDEQLKHSITTSDGQILLAGNTASTDGNLLGRGTHGFNDLWAAKLDGSSGDTLWCSRALGGSGSDWILHAIEMPDGNILLTARTTSTDGNLLNRGTHGGEDIWAVKLDGNTGDTLWCSRALGGSGTEFLIQTIVASDGHIFLAARTASTDGDLSGRGTHGLNDIWVVKLDGNTGDTLWCSRALGGSAEEELSQVIETSDGHLLIAAMTRSTDGDLAGRGTHGNRDFWAVKLDGNTGDTLWCSRALGGSGTEYFYAETTIIVSSDNHILLVGSTQSINGDLLGRGTHGTEDLWVVKLNSNNGDTLWCSRAMGGNGADYSKYSIESPNNQIVIAGYTTSTDGDLLGRGTNGGYDFWVVKLDGLTGDTIWCSRALGGNGKEFLDQTIISPDGHILLAGRTASSDGDLTGGGTHGDDDFWALKLDSSNGMPLLISRAIGGNDREELNQFASLDCGNETGYLFSGDTYTIIANGDVTQSSAPGNAESLWMVKTDSLLNPQWDKVFSDGGPEDAEVGRAFLTADGGYLMTGMSSATNIAGEKTVAGHGGFDWWTIKLLWVEAAFVVDTVCAGTPTQFTDSTKGYATIPNKVGVSWYWDFGDPNTNNDISTEQNPQYTYDNPGTYTVLQVVQKECQRDSFIRDVVVLGELICDENPLDLWMPNTFSPNGDGENDWFSIKAEEIDNILIRIYNSFGKIVFESDELNQGWDGNTNGHTANEGVYIYTLSGFFKNQLIINKVGNISLIR